MNLNINRLYRKNLKSQGLAYIGGEEREITLKNLSVTGALAELKNCSDLEFITSAVAASPTIDIYLPQLQLAGEADVVRIDSKKPNHITLALQFKHISYDVDQLMYKRKAYRKTMSVVGRLLVNGTYYNFFSVNISTDGLMIHLPEHIYLEEGDTVSFQFKELDVEGQAQVIWRDEMINGGILLGLQYINMAKISIKGVPRFTNE
ncbi:MAG: PilZ domain-containing protein [Methylovulum sp.]|nr:PilZ domain-containing protein [Methylovulum sp.]